MAHQLGNTKNRIAVLGVIGVAMPGSAFPEHSSVNDSEMTQTDQ
jgi:hypothetical protein